jgi:hypothetical protein
MARTNNFAARLTVLERAATARKPGIKLTRELPVVLHDSEVDAIAAARAAGKMVWVSDEWGPPNGVIM